METSLQAALERARTERGICCCAAGCPDSAYADAGYWRGLWCGCWCHRALYERLARRAAQEARRARRRLPKSDFGIVTANDYAAELRHWRQSARQLGLPPGRRRNRYVRQQARLCLTI